MESEQEPQRTTVVTTDWRRVPKPHLDPPPDEGESEDAVEDSQPVTYGRDKIPGLEEKERGTSCQQDGMEL